METERSNAGSKALSHARDDEEETWILDVPAAFNRDGLDLPAAGAPGRRTLNMDMLLSNPVFWDWLTEREAEEALMEIYVARTRRAQ